MASINYNIETIRNGIFPSNTYFLIDNQTKDCIIIDPGLDLPALQKAEDKLHCNPIAVIATHGHFDHIGHVAYFQKKYNIPYYLHEKDLKLSKSANFYLKMSKLNMIEIPKPDHYFEGTTAEINIGSFHLSVHNFSGHTEGSCIIQFEDNLFSGDILYKNGLGFNHFPGEDKLKLKQSIIEILAQFSDDNRIYPGHGTAATLATIKNENIDLVAFINS